MSCDHCETSAATLRCPTCAAVLCEACSAVIHAEGKFTLHAPIPHTPGTEPPVAAAKPKPTVYRSTAAFVEKAAGVPRTTAAFVEKAAAAPLNPQTESTLSPIPTNQPFFGTSVAAQRRLQPFPSAGKAEPEKPVVRTAARPAPPTVKPVAAAPAVIGKLCERCEDVAATLTCKECDSNYCGGCSELVHSEGRFATHAVSALPAETAKPAFTAPSSPVRPAVSSPSTSPLRHSSPKAASPARASSSSPPAWMKRSPPRASAASDSLRSRIGEIQSRLSTKHLPAPTADTDSDDDFAGERKDEKGPIARFGQAGSPHAPASPAPAPAPAPAASASPAHTHSHGGRPCRATHAPRAPLSDDEDEETATGPVSEHLEAELLAKIRSKQAMLQSKRTEQREERKQRLRESAENLLSKLCTASTRRWNDSQLDVLRQAGPIQLSGCAEKVANGVPVDVALAQLYAAQLRRLQSRECGPTPKDVLGRQYADLQRCVADVNQPLR